VTRQTEFDSLIAASRFDDAKRLLQAELLAGRLLDPRSDPYWTTFADRLAREIQKTSGVIEVVEFWQSIRDFFNHEIEPAWGHAHKGHIYFRLGLTCLPRDVQRGKMELELAYEEDVRLEQAGKGIPKAQSQSAYIALAILERIDDSQFANQDDKEKFFLQLFQSFDVASVGASIKSRLVEAAFKVILPPEELSRCRAYYLELDEVARRRLPFATVALTGIVLEAVILAILYCQKRITELQNGKDIRGAPLGSLLEEARKNSIFPADSIRVACELIYMFRNRLHPGKEMRQQYKLVPPVASTIKVFFEMAMLDWQTALLQQRTVK